MSVAKINSGNNLMCWSQKKRDEIRHVEIGVSYRKEALHTQFRMNHDTCLINKC